MEKYYHSTEGISLLYWFEIFFFSSLCLFRILLLIPEKYLLIPENLSNLLVSNTKQRFGMWEGRCHSQIFYFTASKTETPLRSLPRLLPYFLIQVESHKFCGILFDSLKVTRITFNKVLILLPNYRGICINCKPMIILKGFFLCSK